MKHKKASFLVYVSCGMVLMEKSNKHGGLHALGGKTDEADYDHERGARECAETTLFREIMEEVGVDLSPFDVREIDRRDIVHDDVLWTETYYRCVCPVDAIESLWHPAVLWVPVEGTELESCATNAGRRVLELAKEAL